MAVPLTTIAKVKLQLGITTSDFDALLTQLVNNVSAWIEGQIGRTIGETAYADDIYDGTRAKDIFLRNWPVTDFTSAEFNAGTLAVPVWQAFDINSYIVYREQGIVHFVAGPPIWKQNLRFAYDAGFDPIPADLEQLATDMVAQTYNARSAGGKKAESVEGASITWAGADAGESELSAEQKAVIAKYQRFNAVDTQV